MAKSCARDLFACIAAIVIILNLTAPATFVSSPIAANVAAGSVTASGALSAIPQAVDVQLLLSRNFGGKFAKAKDLTAPVPDEEGFTDGQVAICLCIALVAGLCAWDLAKTLERGATPNRFKDPKSKGGYITPLYKRFIEMGE